MKVHEYQAKEILRRFGVAIPDGSVAADPEEAFRVAKGLGGRVVVKAQIHAGGRGKAGGVEFAATPEEAKRIAGDILGMRLVTRQTGPEGKIVRRVLIEKASNIERELYLGITLDRASSRLVLIASPEGGVEIEKVASTEPDKIFKVHIDIDEGLTIADIKRLGSRLGLDDKLNEKFFVFVTSLYRAYIDSDASLAEINPLVVTRDGDLIALDAKINIDDNALYRHEDLAKMLDPDEEDPSELEAKRHGLSYISLSGNIGCVVNGAGLAMATMDIIKLAGGEPANFLDVGGAATKENVAHAFEIVLSDKKVRAILVNIFGGIVKCDLIADGIIYAARKLGVKVPIVVRLHGTNVEKGRKLLKKSGLNMISAETLGEAAKKVVEVAK